MPGYSRKDFDLKINNALTNMDTYYQQDFINYRGRTTDTKESYTEIISELLLNNLKLFDYITTISRKSSYRVPGHNGCTGSAISNRVEERIVLGIYNKEFNYIGKVIDYQVPLKNVQSDKNTGKIDLLALYQNELIILELKKEDSQETLLRCILEAATYFRKIDKDKLIKDYEQFNADKVRCGILVFKDQSQHKEYKIENTYTRKLMHELKVDMYIINEYDDLLVKDISLP